MDEDTMRVGSKRTMAAGVVTAGCCLAVVLGFGSAAVAQDATGGMKTGGQAAGKKLPSPPAIAMVKLDGKGITIKYNAPSVRDRKIVGGLVPYGKVWRTGANPATTLITAAHLKIGTLDVPAGTYTIYSLPSESDAWMLIVNKQTGQWGTEYDESKDLGRTAMTGNALASPQEVMSISFENVKGKTAELHVKWEKTDEYVTVTAE